VPRYPGISATDLAPHAGLVHAPDSAPTSSQLRTLDEHLQTLAGLGLVQVEPDGTWSPAVTTELEPEVLRPAQAAQQAVDDAVSAEREAYRHVTFSRSSR
jgi:DNA-binding transcriptional ArsR family regulator